MPPSNITSLNQFHVAFHHYCKEFFPVDFLYLECCYEFDLLSKRSNSHIEYDHVEEYAAVDDIFHDDQEVHDPQSDSQIIDTFDIISDVSTILNGYEKQVFYFEYSNDNEQIDISACISF